MMAGQNMRQFQQEIRAGIYGGNMSNNYAASVMRDKMDNKAGMYCTPRDPQADEMTRQMLRDEVARHRAKVGMPALPEHTQAADNGQRVRRSDKVSDPVNQPAKLKHGHYFKDVSQLTTVDVYRVCALFGVNDPSGATHHAIKKLLLPGQRGAGKDAIKDLQEAVDTLNRRLEMLKEDAAA